MRHTSKPQSSTTTSRWLLEAEPSYYNLGAAFEAEKDTPAAFGVYLRGMMADPYSDECYKRIIKIFSSK